MLPPAGLKAAPLDDAGKPTGLGAPGTPAGYGCAGGACAASGISVQELISLGTPKLAYSVACGYALIPWDIPIQGTWANTATTDVANIGNANKVVQDTVVTEVNYTITNQNTPGGNDSLNNWGYIQSSGIQGRLHVVGGMGGGYTPVPNFSPLEVSFRRKYHPRWLITWNQGLVIDLHATVVLPFTVQVTVNYMTMTTPSPSILEMTNREALQALASKGYDISTYVPG